MGIKFFAYSESDSFCGLLNYVFMIFCLVELLIAWKDWIRMASNFRQTYS